MVYSYAINSISPIFTIATPGRSTVLLDYNTTDSSMFIVRSMFGWFWVGPFSGSRLVPVVLDCNGCSPNSSFNFAVWLTSQGSISRDGGPGSVQEAQFNRTLFTVAACKGTFERGCADIKLPPRLFLPDKDDLILTFPLVVSCLSASYIQLQLRASKVCGQELIGPFSCDDAPTSVTFNLSASANCSFSHGNANDPATWTLNMWDNETYSFSSSNPDYASYSRDYSFTVSYPFVSAPYSSTEVTELNLEGITVLAPPDAAFNDNGTITVTSMPQDSNTHSGIVRIEFDDSDGPKSISNLSSPAIPIPPIPLINICLDEAASEQRILPECKYYDTMLKQWITQGCTRTNLNATDIECSCVHLTDFAGVLPNYNAVPLSAVLDLTPSNIAKYPTGIVSVFIVLGLFSVLFAGALYRDQKEAAALTDLRALKQVKWGKYLARKRLGHKLGVWKEVKIGFQLRHTWSALLDRKSGTSFRSVDRSIVALVTVFASMTISTRFHNVEQNWLGRGEVIFFSVLVCLLPAQIFTQLFVWTGAIGFYEERLLAIGIRRPLKFKLLNIRFPSYFRWVWIALALICIISMIVNVLTISLIFDQNPKYYCFGNTAKSWVTDWLASYAVTVLLVDPLKIVGLSRYQEHSLPISSSCADQTSIPQEASMESRDDIPSQASG